MAASAGYPIETDIRILSCGTLVLFHDETLERMTGSAGSVHGAEYGDISTLKILNTEEVIPKFDEMLSLVDGRVPIMIEIKNEKKIPRLGETLVKLLKGYGGECSVHSFDPDDIAWFAENEPSITRGMVFEYFTEGEYVYAERVAKPGFMVFYTENIPADKVEACKRSAKPVLVYTSRSQKEQNETLKVCDNVVFEGYRPR
jgi:glycerophosphoryl diester phosphodiesterase